MMELGERLLGTALGQEMILRKSSRESLNSMNSIRMSQKSIMPYQNQKSIDSKNSLMKRKEEEFQSQLVPYTQIQSKQTQPKLTKELKDLKKKEIIDFSQFNRHLFLKDNEFLYLKRVGNPIEYIECVYSDLVPNRDKKKKVKAKVNVEYLTMSKNTVMHYQNEGSFIYSVPEWVDFYVKFRKLLDIRIFKNYRTRKLFDLWRKFYKKSIKTLQTEKLKKRFHFIDESLLTGIMEIRAILKEMSQVNIFKLEVREPITLTKFQEEHKFAIKELDKMIETYRKNVKKCTEIACGISYQEYKELKKITLEDNLTATKDKKDKDEQSVNKSVNKTKDINNEGNFVQNFLKDAMPYAQDATRRTHYKKLLRYIRVVDFLFNEAKYSMIKNSLQQLADKFARLFECCVNNYVDNPLIVLYDLPLQDSIHYIPHMDQIHKAVFEEFIQEKIYAVIYRKSFIDPQEFPSYMVCFEEVFETSVDQNSNLNIRIKEDYFIGHLFYKIKINFENCHLALDKFTKDQLDVLIKYNTYSSINFKTLEEESSPEELKSLLDNFIIESQKIALIKKKKNLGIFQFNMGNLIEKVSKAPSKWITDMRELIPTVLRNKLKHLISILNGNLKRLNIPVVDVESFISLKSAIKDIYDIKDSIDNKNSDINDILNIIRDDKEIKIPEFDTKYIKEKEALFVEFEKKLSDMNYFLENNMSKYKKELRDNISRFDKEIKNMMEELNVDILNVYNEDNYSAIFYIENKSVAIKKLIDKKEFFRKQEELIEMEDMSNFENLDNLVYDYDLKYKLWESVREFQEVSKKWDNGQILVIELENMELLLNNWTETGKIAEADLENPNVPRVLLQKTRNYELILPVLKTFQNSNVNTDDSFRENIKSILNTENDIKEKEFTLEKLMNLSDDVYEKIPDILELNNKANEEKRLTNIYNEIKENFNTHKIPLKLERSSKQNNEKGSEKWVIYPKDYDNEYEWLEEKLMTLKKSLLTPYAEIVRDRVNKLLVDCMKYSIFLDEFNVYQRFSNVIDSIFTPENLREVSSDYKKFLNESFAKTLTKLLKENSVLIRFVDVSQKIMNNLQQINKNYEEFFAYVEDFLENKRKECLKYFLVSNEELLEILSNPDSHEIKNKYISKMFNGMKSVDLGNEAEEWMKVYTVDEETLTIKLTKGKTFKDIIESIELDVSKKLKQSFKSFRKDYENSMKSKSAKKPKDVIIDIIKNRDNLAQSIFIFMYSYLIDLLEKALSTDDVFDKIIDIKIESKERRKNFIKGIKDLNATNLDRRVLLNQLALENYFTEITKNLIREDCNSINDFNWQKILQVKLDSEQINIKVFNSANFEYGYEYVGLHNNFIVTPHTEKLYLTIANCFTLRRPFFMYGLNESGKKETMTNLSKMFGKQMTVFKCSEQFDVNSFNRQLYANVKNGSWLCLDNVELIQIEMMSIVAQEIMNVYRGLSDKESFVHFRNDKFLIEKSIQIFCMNNLTHKVPNISGNIKNYFRLIGTQVPDLKFFIRASFKNLGFSKIKVYSRKCAYLIEYINSKTASLGYKRICLNLFSKALHRLEKDVTRITNETIDKFLRKSFERIFTPFLSTQENLDLMRLLNNIFSHKEPAIISHGSMIDNSIEEVIRGLVKEYNFKGEKGEEYIQKLKDIYFFLNKRDLHLLVGPSASGKSKAMEIVTKAAEILHETNPTDNRLYKIVKVFPKANDSIFMFSENQRFSKIQFYNVFFYNQIKMLYNIEKSKNVTDQISTDMRSSPDRRKREDQFDFEKNLDEISVENDSMKILYFDGQIDPTWIEHLNFIHSNNKTQCLPNGDTMDLSDIKFMFETPNLSYATPSFITKNFIVNFNVESFNWENILYNWINLNPKINTNIELKNYTRGLYENYFPKLYEFIMNNKFLSLNFSENYVLKNFFTLFDSVMPQFDFEEKRIGRKNQNAIPKIEIIKKSTLSIFIFSCAWTLNFFTNFVLRTKIEKFISDIFKADDLKGPIFDYFIDEEKYEFELWSNKLENLEQYKIDLSHKINDTRNFTYNKIFIPTVENIPYQWIVEKYLKLGVPVFYTGKPGIGKSLILNSLMNNLSEDNSEWNVHHHLINHNSTTKKFENFLFQNLHYVKRDTLGDLYDRKVIILIDDCNLQKKDNYYSQSVLESVRQILSTNNIYDMKNNVTKNFNKLNIICCGNISSYFKNFNMDRLIHSFCLVTQNNFSDEVTNSVFKYTLENQIKHFIPTTSAITTNQFVNATLLLLENLKSAYKLSPSKIHYRFQMRDATKIFQSVHNFLYINNSSSDYTKSLEKLWFYEVSRVCEDRMIKDGDRIKFREEALKSFNSVFKKNYKAIDYFGVNHLFAYDVIKNSNEKNVETENIIDTTNIYNYIFYEDTTQLFTFISQKLTEYHSRQKHKHVMLNQSTFELVLKIIRIFQFNKGHLILFGPTLAGKMSTTQFVAHILNKNFINLDESNLPKIDQIIKNVIIETSYKNNPTILFINNSLLEKEDVLEILNMLINTREILNNFDIIKLAEKEVGFKLAENEIIHRIEKNLNIVMSALSDSISYNKLYQDYPYISKHSSALFIEKWDKLEFINLVRDNVTNISQLDTKFVDFSTLMYETHVYIKVLADTYSNKVMCKIEISSKNFIQMITHFENNLNLYRDKLLNQKKKYENAADVITKTRNMIEKLNEEMEKLEPEKAEQDKQTDEKKTEFSKKQVQKTHITNLKNEEEKPLQFSLNQKEDINEQIYKNLEDFVERVTKTSKDLNKLSKTDLLDFKNYIENHNLSKHLLSQIYSYQSESSEWDFIKKNLDPKFIQSVVNIDYSNAPANLVKFVRETVAYPDFVTSEQIQKPFKTCGLFSDWFQALSDYFREFENQKSLMDEVEELNKKIHEHEKIIKSHTENLIEISKQIAEIEKQLSAIDKKKQVTVAQIEKREILKKIGEEMIETALEKNEIWENKKDLIDITLVNIEFYTIFISVYLNYATCFNSSYRNKIKNYLYSRADELHITDLRNLDFNLALEFIELKTVDKELELSLAGFDDYTKENFLIMYLSKKVPFIIDNNRICKWYLSEYLQWKEPKKLIFTKPYEPDFMDNVETALKEGLYLIIEQADDKSYQIFKNVIKDEKTHEKGKSYVMIENTLKEINEKFRIFFIKDKIDSKINSKFWIETLILNFAPSKDQIKWNLQKELSINEDPITYNSFTKTNLDKIKEQAKLSEVEDRIINYFNQFDFSGNVDKNNSNQNSLGLLKYEVAQHTQIMESIEMYKEKLYRLQGEIFKFKELADDAACLYKWMARFIFLDSIYNFSFFVYGKYIKEYYREKVLSRDEKYPEYSKEEFMELILYLYEKVSLLFSFDQRKLLIFSLLLSYLNRKGEINKNYKLTLNHVLNIFFNGNLDHDTYNEESPIKSISNFQWNCLKEINDKSSFEFSVILEDIQKEKEIWEKFLSNGFTLNENGFTFNFNEELNNNTSILIKIVFFIIIFPHRIEQIMLTLFNNIIGKSFAVPRLKLNNALEITPNRKVILIIDNEYLSEKEIINYYSKKYSYEGSNFYRHINLENELTHNQFELFNNAIKNGLLIIIRNIQFAKQSLQKIFEILQDPKLTVNESFRLVFITKSNLILSSLIYEHCVLLNRNIPKFTSIKDSIQDTIENIDMTNFDFLMNRNYNTLQSRKIVYHLLITHSILNQYSQYHIGIFNNPLEFSKKDFLNCFYFISNYLNSLGEEKENINNNLNNYSNNNYSALMNLVFESFYCNRLVYKEESLRLMKILQRYFQEDKFLQDGYYFLFKNNLNSQTVEIKSEINLDSENNINLNLTTEDILKSIDQIPLENYYEMILNVPSEIINEKLSLISKDLLKNFSIIYSSNKEVCQDDYDELDYDQFDMDKFSIIVNEFKRNLPEIISIRDESSPQTFKVNKHNEYFNPIDESLLFEVNSYNKFLTRVYHHIDNMNKIFTGEIILDDEYYQMMKDLMNKDVPKKWKDPCFTFKRLNYVEKSNTKITLNIWRESLLERFNILRRWLINSQLEVYHANLFYNMKLFLFSVTNYFSKKVNVSPENINLKFILTNLYNSENFNETNQIYIKDLMNKNKNREIIFCNGFVLENAFLDVVNLKLVNYKENSNQTFENLPLVAITFIIHGEDEKQITLDDSEDEEDYDDEDAEGVRAILVPIFDRENPEKFENVEALGTLELLFDLKYKEDFWISKAVKISIDF